MGRHEKVANLIRELAAKFIGREASSASLITITRADCSPDLRRATIYMTVLPVSYEQAALDFAKRKRGELRRHILKNLASKVAPFIDFEIDRGEKNRQK